MISKITTQVGRPIIAKRQNSDGAGNYSPPERSAAAEDTLLEAVNNVSSYVQNTSREVHVYVDEDSGDRQVSIVDSRTGQIIRHLPADEVLALSRHIASHASDPIKGMLVKSKA